MLSIQELYQYSSRVRRRFANKLSELPWEEVNKNREASFHSMKNILIHIIDNEDRIANYVIQGRAREYSQVKKPDEYTDMKQVLVHLDEVEAKTKAYLGKLSEEDMKKRVEFILNSGKVLDLSVEESLFQSFTEQLYHLGEMIALFWQDDIEPPQMQWFWNNPRSSSQ